MTEDFDTLPRLTHQQFRKAGFTWRVVFEKSLNSVRVKDRPAWRAMSPAEKALNKQQRTRIHFALRVHAKGAWNACAVGFYRDGRCVPEDYIFRDDIGQINLDSVLQRAAECFSTSREPVEMHHGVMINIYTFDGRCGKTCVHCARVEAANKAAKLKQRFQLVDEEEEP